MFFSNLHDLRTGPLGTFADFSASGAMFVSPPASCIGGEAGGGTGVGRRSGTHHPQTICRRRKPPEYRLLRAFCAPRPFVVRRPPVRPPPDPPRPPKRLLQEMSTIIIRKTKFPNPSFFWSSMPIDVNALLVKCTHF